MKARTGRLRLRLTGAGLVGLLLSPFTLIVVSVVLIRFVPAPSAGKAFTLNLLLAAPYLIAATAFFSGLFALTRPRLQWRWDNHTLQARVAHFVDLLSLAKRSVVIVTGCLHRSLYNADDVVAALEDLPEGIEVCVYHERALDELSARFRRELRRRRAVICRIPAHTISHGAIVDARHIKIEQFGVDDAEDEKCAEYYLFAPKRARKALDQIEALVDANATRELNAA